MPSVNSGGYSTAPGAIGAGRPRNPFGLPTGAAPMRNATATPAPMVAQNPVTTHVVAPNPSGPSATPAVLPMAPPAQNTAPAASPLNPAAVSSPGITPYNINADPALQMAYASAGLSNAQAQAQATSQEAQLVEQAGIPSLAAALGLNANVGTIAQNNKFSDAANLLNQEQTANQASQTSYNRNVQDLGTQNTAAVQNLVNQLVNANEVFSGYGNYQKGLQAQQYQQALDRESQDLATALTGNTHQYQQGVSDLTGQVQSQIGQIQQALAQTQGANAQAEIQAMQQAYATAIAALEANGGASGTPTGGAGGAGGGAAGGAGPFYVVNGVTLPVAMARPSGAAGGPGPQL